MDRTPSAVSLDAWCDAERGRAAMLARELGVTPTSIHDYRRGAMRPDKAKRYAIETLTGGASQAAGWETEAANAPVAKAS